MKFSLVTLILFVLISCGTKKNVDKNPQVSLVNEAEYITKFHEGLRSKSKGQFAQAIQLFEACKILNPKDDAVYFALSQLYLQTQQLAKSAESIQSALKLDPKNKWYVQEYAFMLFETKNFKEAAKQFKKLSEEEPGNIDWLFSYAESLMRSNDIAGSIKVLDKLENEIGSNPELSIQKFQMYRQIKQDEKAVQELLNGLKENPSDNQLLANLVDFYFEKKQDAKAFEYLKQLAENDPNNGNAHLALAQFYDKGGDKKSSYQELILAFKSDQVKIDTKVKILLSMFESQYNLDKEMFELADLLVENYPNDARVYTVRGDFYLKSLQDSLALIDFKKALEFDKTKYVIWDQVLLMEYQNQNYSELYKDAKNCLEYFSSLPKVYLLFGIAANQTKNSKEAIDKLIFAEDLIVNDNSMKAEVKAQLGDAYFAEKQINEGKTAYEQALKLDPKNNLYKNNYAYRLALAKTDLDKALSLIQDVLEKSPNESHFIDTYAWVLFQKENYKEALEQFQKALVLAPNDKHILEHLGDAYFKVGNVNEALNYWKKAKELGSTNLKLSDKIEKKTYYDPVY